MPSPTRVCLFTDTLGDVNGVSRFIRNIADQSLVQGRDLHVLASTRFACPGQPNIHNIPPWFSRPMPGYPTLDIVWPDARELTRGADAIQPHAIHVSTPGPVGMVGRRYALKRGLPLLGTYHTDFPAYIAHLFDDDTLTWVTTQAMRRFYAPFAAIFTRSDDYAAALHVLGISPERVRKLLPGIDTKMFHMEHRDPSCQVWRRIVGARTTSLKAIYVGRVSVEKNLPMLARVWITVVAQCRARKIDAQLIVVGDGPYRSQMQRELGSHDAVFAGFRHGQELSTIYASSDLFLFPSETDTLGQVVMESQSAGLPVIVTNKGGPREVVDHERTGFVLKNERDWATTIVRLLEDHALRRAMGAAAHLKILPMSIEHSFASFWEAHEAAASSRQKEKKPGRTLASVPTRR